jgi:hypothetical protein
MGMPPVRVDILMSIGGVTFQEAWFIGRAELIRNKRAVGRHIDLHDAELLG